MNIKENKLGLIPLVSISGAIIKPHPELLKENLENHFKAGDHRGRLCLLLAPKGLVFSGDKNLDLG